MFFTFIAVKRCYRNVGMDHELVLDFHNVQFARYNDGYYFHFKTSSITYVCDYFQVDILHNLLHEVLEPIVSLKADVKRKAMMR